MAIPKFPDFLKVVLLSLQDGREHPIQRGENSIKDYVIARFNLNEDDLKEMVPSGQQPKYYNRLSWSLTYLRKSGLVEMVSRGIFRITSLGVSELGNVDKINIKYLRKYQGFVEFTSGYIANDGNNREEDSRDDGISVDDSPEDNLSLAFNSLNNALISNLKEEVMRLTPDQFERLVIRLLLKMGYITLILTNLLDFLLIM